MLDPKSNRDFLAKWNRAVPRYTSYPTAPQFYAVEESTYRDKLLQFASSKRPLSLYLHIPFCKTMCLFCACSVSLNRRPERQKRYLDFLAKEIELLPFQEKQRVVQLHFGGGTPTSLSEEEFEELMARLKTRFFWEASAELSIEIDPRTVFADQGKKLLALKQLGFNRVSFGVQDLDPRVQEAVKRRQSEEMTRATFQEARRIGFQGINLDLIYGLPHQTRERFGETVEKIVEMRPDRIALFSYAKVPWLKPHQKAIAEEALPSTEEKLQIYLDARSRFLEGGYIAIGMDHFALEGDALAQGYLEKKLSRNFQGYSPHLADDLLGLGMSSIGFLGGAYFQNAKAIEDYEALLEKGHLPVRRGFLLGEEDQKRHFAIQSLMCHFELDKKEFQRLFHCDFEVHFSKERPEIERLKKEGLLEESPSHLLPTPLGRLFIRLIAAVFDAYLSSGRYSRAI